MIIYPENESISVNQDTWTVQRVLTSSTGWLKEKSSNSNVNCRFEAELLLANVLLLDRMKLYLQLDRPLTRDERDAFKVSLRRRAEGESIAYILGYRDFYRHRFQVSPAVLIPRPDTELLVELALTAARSFDAPEILDIGTGTGCIGISLASEIPEAKVSAWDISEEAIGIAHANMVTIGVKNLTIRLCDALAADIYPDAEFDIIVSNPPYIARDEQSIMSRETLNFEPKLALFSPDNEGLDFYKIFAENCQKALRPQGRIFLEIGLNQGAKVAQLFNDAGWRKILIVKDSSGHDRVVTAERV